MRKSSFNTVSSYRYSLNYFIDYLEQEKQYNRKEISFQSFNRINIKDYIDWMLNKKNLSPKTCNLRLTAVHALMEYASQESLELMSCYMEVCTVKAIKTQKKPIEYFNNAEMAALLSAPDTKKASERRNQMMLIFLYDTATRVSEMLDVKIRDFHLSAEPAYVTVCGKGRKYRNIPIMEKSRKHLDSYFREFHAISSPDVALFYATTHGEKHPLSADTVEKMLKRYAVKCKNLGCDMPDNAHCHMIRKTRAMDLYQQGIPLPHIQQLLGHESMSTTSGFYAFATLDTLAKSLETANKSQTDKKWHNEEVMKKLYRL
jgi:site-specific recombinase XerD